MTFHCTKMKFSIEYFSSKCDQIRGKLQIWSHLLKKSLMINFFVPCLSQEILALEEQRESLKVKNSSGHKMLQLTPKRPEQYEKFPQVMLVLQTSVFSRRICGQFYTKI